MSDIRDPETDQQLPIPNDRKSCQDMVIEDIEKRKELGLKKYGTLLQPFNGRSFLQDAYEEVLDLAVYLRGRLEEERENAMLATFGPTDLGQATLIKPSGSDYETSIDPAQMTLWGKDD